MASTKKIVQKKPAAKKEYRKLPVDRTSRSYRHAFAVWTMRLGRAPHCLELVCTSFGIRYLPCRHRALK
jgi:hypothetical protein